MHHTDPHVRRAVRRQTTPPPTPPPQPRRPVNWVGGDHSRRIKPDSLLADAQRREQDRPGRAAGPDRPVHHRSGCSVRTTDTTVAQGKRPAVVKPRLAAFGHARKLQQPHTTHYLAAVRGVVQVAVVGGASVADQPVVAGDAHRVAVGIEGKGTSTTLENTASLGVSESGPTNSAVLPLRVLLATGAGRWGVHQVAGRGAVLLQRGDLAEHPVGHRRVAQPPTGVARRPYACRSTGAVPRWRITRTTHSAKPSAPADTTGTTLRARLRNNSALVPRTRISSAVRSPGRF